MDKKTPPPTPYPYGPYDMACFKLLFFSKTIMINIIDCEEYEKNKNFYVELGEPRVSNRETEYYDIVSFPDSSVPRATVVHGSLTLIINSDPKQIW